MIRTRRQRRGRLATNPASRHRLLCRNHAYLDSDVRHLGTGSGLSRGRSADLDLRSNARRHKEEPPGKDPDGAIAPKFALALGQKALSLAARRRSIRAWANIGTVVFNHRETDMGNKDKGKREQQKKAQRSPKEKRQLRREQKSSSQRSQSHLIRALDS